MNDKYVNIIKFLLNKFGIIDESYKLDCENEDNNIYITVHLKDDMIGKVIGKNGNLIASIRNIVNDISKKDKVFVKITIKGL